MKKTNFEDVLIAAIWAGATLVIAYEILLPLIESFICFMDRL